MNKSDKSRPKKGGFFSYTLFRLRFFSPWEKQVLCPLCAAPERAVFYCLRNFSYISLPYFSVPDLKYAAMQILYISLLKR